MKNVFNLNLWELFNQYKPSELPELSKWLDYTIEDVSPVYIVNNRRERVLNQTSRLPVLQCSQAQQDLPQREELLLSNKTLLTSMIHPLIVELPLESPIKGTKTFEDVFNKVEATNLTAKLYRRFLTQTAKLESGFRSNVINSIGATGYFQLMPANIKQFSGVSQQEYRSNPELQIHTASKLIDYFKSRFTPKDYAQAKSKGYTENAMLAACWLGGLGGMRAALNGRGNRKDSNGTSVISRMKQFNF